MSDDKALAELECYDAGLLNDFGGGNVEWWQDYIRAELERAHEFYQSQLTQQPSPQADEATALNKSLLQNSAQRLRMALIGTFDADEFNAAVAQMRTALTSQPQPAANPQVPDDECVICPSCAHQFRAIPVQVQSMLMANGDRPPFLATPQARPDGEKAVAWRFWVDDPDSCFNPHWTGWSADNNFKELCLKLGHRVEYAYPPHPAPAPDAVGRLVEAARREVEIRTMRIAVVRDRDQATAELAEALQPFTAAQQEADHA